MVEPDELDHAAGGAHLLGLGEGLDPGGAADAVDDHLRPPGAEPLDGGHRVLPRAVHHVVGEAGGEPAAALQSVHGHQPARLPLAHHLQQDAAHQPLAEDDDVVPRADHGAVGPGQAARGQGQEGGGLEADLVGQGHDPGPRGLADGVLGVGGGDDDPVPGAGIVHPRSRLGDDAGGGVAHARRVDGGLAQVAAADLGAAADQGGLQAHEDLALAGPGDLDALDDDVADAVVLGGSQHGGHGVKGRAGRGAAATGGTRGAGADRERGRVFAA